MSIEEKRAEEAVPHIWKNLIEDQREENGWRAGAEKMTNVLKAKIMNKFHKIK